MIHGCGSLIMVVVWVASAIWGMYSFLVYTLDQEWYVAFAITVLLVVLTLFGLGEEP